MIEHWPLDTTSKGLWMNLRREFQGTKAFDWRVECHLFIKMGGLILHITLSSHNIGKSGSNKVNARVPPHTFSGKEGWVRGKEKGKGGGGRGR